MKSKKTAAIFCSAFMLSCFVPTLGYADIFVPILGRDRATNDAQQEQSERGRVLGDLGIELERLGYLLNFSEQALQEENQVAWEELVEARIVLQNALDALDALGERRARGRVWDALEELDGREGIREAVRIEHRALGIAQEELRRV